MMAKWQSGTAAIVFFIFSENFLTNGGKFALLTSTFFIVRAVDLEKTQINLVFYSLIRNFAQQLIIR